MARDTVQVSKQGGEGGRVAVVRRDTWDDHWVRRRGRDPHRKARSFRYASSLELWPREARTALDVAGGDGTFAFLARERYPSCELMVIDSSAAAAASARDRGLLSMVVSVDGGGLPFADASFDVVTSLSVLQDVLQPWALLEEMARVSRRWVLLSCPNFASLGNRWDLLWGGVPRQMRLASHVRFITYAEVKRRMQELGLRPAACLTRHKLPLLRDLPALPLTKPRRAHLWLPNLASKFTVLGEKMAG